MGLIYKITNSLNGKVYIGKTEKTIEERWKRHIRRLKNPTHYIQCAMKKYGHENFSIETIEEVVPSQLSEREKYWIAYFNSTDNTTGYNLTFGGDGGIPTDEIRQKISRLAKGRVFSKEHRENISKAKTGIVYSEEYRRKMSEATKGRIMTETHREHLSESAKGRIIPEEVRRKISQSRRGFIMSEESCRKMSESRKGRHHSIESRQKLSEADKRRWQLKREGIGDVGRTVVCK